ncbi:MAG TPA: alpha/beta hydrolase, partial [Acidimicrobiales bacterium]|nr:alpha/beta hydrolase [Acidimicrobiales bacterium]
MTGDPSRRFEVDGVELAWDEWGDDTTGAPFVLCHGFSGSTFDFALQIDALAADRRVVALDHRGHGLSTNTGDLSTYSVAQLTDDFLAWLDGAVGEPVDLLGHSLGGRISLGAVLARPDLVRSLILMDTTAWSFLPEDLQMRAMMAAFIENFDPAGGLPDPTLLRGPEDTLIEAVTPQSWRDRKLELYEAVDPYLFKAIGTELFTPGILSVRDRLAEITCPVTVLVGENDHPFVDQADELAAEVPNGRVAVIEGAYHSP